MSELPTNAEVIAYRQAREDKDPELSSKLRSLRSSVYDEIRQYKEALPDIDKMSDWQQAALCRAFPELMFPAQGEKVISDLAKEACGACVALSRCKGFALENSGNKQPAQYGIWGGLTERERRKRAKDLKSTVSVNETTTESDPDGEAA